MAKMFKINEQDGPLDGWNRQNKRADNIKDMTETNSKEQFENK